MMIGSARRLLGSAGVLRSPLMAPRVQIRRFSQEEQAQSKQQSEQTQSKQQSEQAPPWRKPRGAPRKKYPYFRDWVTSPYGILSMVGVAFGTFVLGSWGVRTYKKMTAMYAENKLVQTLQEEGSEQAYYRFMYAQLARQVLAVPRIAQHMGDLRFSPDTMKPFQFPKDNEICVIFNVYGTRRVGLVNVVMRKGVNSAGLPVYDPIEFSVDSWDGRVFKVPLGHKLDFSLCLDEVLRLKDAKRDPRLASPLLA